MKGFVLAILAVLVIGAIGAGAYQMGVAAALAGSGAAAAAPYYGPHWGWGFGFPFFGLLFPLLFFFLIFGLISAAFRGGRGWGHGPWMDRRTMAEEWHRQMHADTKGAGETGTPRRE